MTTSPALDLTQQLIARPSVTPDDAGCQQLIAARLAEAGFQRTELPRGDISNLWAVAGDDTDGPLVCLAGHTDVVPAGDVATWRFDPFQPTFENGRLYGRGAADMKTGVAAAICAAETFRARHPDHRGRLAVLLTSDEEGPAIEGTKAVVEWLSSIGETIDYSIVAEPSSTNELGDTIRVGRRGSLNARICAPGRQSHVAYTENADNAAHRLSGLVHELTAVQWDNGDLFFPPTSFQVSNLTAGTGAENMIPATATAVCNWRFNTSWSEATLRADVEARCQAHGIAPDMIEWRCSGEPFVTERGALLDAASQAINDQTGHDPTLSTGGGTSDARYIAPTGAEVLEIGPCNATIHQIDECVTEDDPEQLSAIFLQILETILGPQSGGTRLNSG